MSPPERASAAGITKYARTAGGNWTADATWSTTSGGIADTVAPTSEDDVVFDANSGNVTIDAAAVAKSLNCAGYTGILTHSASDFTISGSLTFSSSMTYTPSGATRIVFNGSGTSDITTNGIHLNRINFNNSGDTFRIQDDLNIDYSGTSASFYHQAGTFDPNGHSVIINGESSYIAGNTTFYNLTKVGTATALNEILFGGDYTITGTLTFNGNSTTNRLLVKSNTIGSARTFTVTGATKNFSNVDFQDITFNNGGSNLDLSAITGGSGDSGGNSMSGGGTLTMTTAVKQYWQNVAGGNWSTAANWTSRVPLPQDDVDLGNTADATPINYNSGVTVTADMPRLGKSIDWTGATYTAPTAPRFRTDSLANTIYGSLTLISGMSYTPGGSSAGMTVAGRGNYTLITAGKSFGTFGVSVPTGTFNLGDSFTNAGTFAVNYGTFKTNGFSLSTPCFFSASSNVRTVDLTNSTVTSSGAGGSWQFQGSSNLTFISTGSTIIFGSAPDTFYSTTGMTYNDIVINPSATAMTFSGGFTFNNMTMGSAGSRTIKFGQSVTYTMTGTNFLSGTNGNIITIDSRNGSTPFTLSKTTGTVTADFTALARSTAQGGATWNATHSTNTGGNTGWNFFKSAVSAGGNWSATSTWYDGVVPTASTDVYLDSVSGPVTIDATAVAKSLTCTGYTNTLTHNTGIGLTISGSLTLSAGMTYSPADDTSAITMNDTGTLTSATKAVGDLTFNGSGKTFTLADGLATRAATTIVTLTQGTLKTDGASDNSGLTHSWGMFNGNNANTKTLTLGTSNITLTGTGIPWNIVAVTFNCGTGTITLSGATGLLRHAGFTGADNVFNAVIFSGSGIAGIDNGGTFLTFGTLTRTGTAAKTDSFILKYNHTITGTLTLAGNSATDRLLVYSNTIGTARTLTVTGATKTFSNVDFQDITFANGGSDLDLSGITGGSGDCGGNTGITFTPADDWYWHVNSGSWSDNTKWYTETNGGGTRMDADARNAKALLPQDTPIFDASSIDSGAQTLTIDMPRLPATSFANVTNTPTVLMSTTGLTYSWYGSAANSAINLTGVGTFTSNKNTSFLSRSNMAVTSNSKIWCNSSGNVYIYMPGAILTLADVYTEGGGGTYLYNGTLTTIYNVTTARYATIAGTTTNMGGGLWTVTSNGTYIWNMGGTFNSGSSSIALTYTGATASVFSGGTSIYNNIQIAPGSGVLTFSGAFTFANMTMASAGTKTVKFTKSTTYTMTGSNFLNGTSGNLVTIDSDDSATAWTLNKTSGTVIADYVSMNRSTASGGATFYLTANSSGTGNTGWTASGAGSIKTISPAGGNWSATGAWNEGSPPSATDDVYALASSGNVTINAAAVAKSANFSNYGTHTLTHNTATVLTVSGDLTLVSTMTYTPADDTAAIIINATSNITTGGKIFGNFTINSSGITATFQDSFTQLASTTTLTLTQGTLNTNNQAVTIGWFAPANSASAILTLGSSTVNIAGRWNGGDNTSWILNSNTSIINVTGTIFYPGIKTYNTVNLNGAGNYNLTRAGTYTNFSRNGTAVKTDSLTLWNTQTVTGTLTVAGNSASNRVMILSNTIGTQRTLTAASNLFSNVDFQDITLSGAQSTELSGIPGLSGDCGGNSNITFTPGVTQTWTNAAGGNWSTVGNWSGRVPLPQDDVIMNRSGGYNSGVTVTADMPRLGKSIDWTGATYTGTKPIFASTANTIYGSLTLISGVSITSGGGLTFAGRGNYAYTSATNTITTNVYLTAPNGSLTLQDAAALGTSNALTINNGTFNTNGNTLTIRAFNSNNSNTRAINISNSIVSFSAANDGSWNTPTTTGLTFTATGSTIQMNYSGSTATTFAGGTNTYNNIQIAPGSGVLTFSGAFTFANMTMASAGTKTIKFTHGHSVSDAVTMTGTNFLNGSASGAVTIDSEDGATQFYLTKASGVVNVDYANVSRAKITGSGKWFLTQNSTPQPDPNINGNEGWSTDIVAPSNPTTTTANVDGTSIVDSSWINLAGTINFQFTGAADADSGVLGYYTYFGIDPAGNPTTYQAHSGAIGDNQSTSASTSTADDGKHFYFRVKTKDGVGNISVASTLFNFGYDITLPTRPTFVAANPAGYTTVNSFAFTWPAGTDPNGPGGGASGIKWYEYKRATDGSWSHTADANTRTVSAITAYQEGANAFYVRTVDNVDNISNDYQQVTYYWSGTAPEKPTNLVVTPDLADINEFTISWDKSVINPGDPPVVGYYYSINATPTVSNVTYVASQDDHVSIGSSPFATIQGLNTVYVLGVNAAGNLSYEPEFVASATFTCQTPAPPTPTEVGLSDSSNRAYDTWSLTLAWTAGAGQGATFDHYSIERSINGTDFTALATSAGTAFIDVNGLNNSTTYFYRVKAVDNAGKESAPSSVVSKTPTGNFLTPPTILSAPTVSEIKSTGGKISWTTNRSSSSIVRFGKKNDGTFETSSGQFDAVVSHNVNLLGLSPATLYYFQVQSLDECRDYLPDLAYSTTYSFTTAEAPAISATKVENITLTTVDISFDTTTVATSTIYYGESTSYGKQVDDVSGAQATKHKVKLNGLNPGTTYHFRIKGTDVDVNPLLSDDYQFDTLPLPKIENLKIEAIPGKPQSAFTARWTTNVPTTTILKYKTGNDQYKESVKNKSETGHLIEINNLADNSEYLIVASGRDEIGNIAESSVSKFTTPLDTRPPIISGLQVETSNIGNSQTGSAQVAVFWKTDEPATSKVEFGFDSEGDYTQATSEDGTLQIDHTVIISDLDPSKPYHLKAISKDKAGNVVESGGQTFITSEAQKGIWDLILSTLNNIFGFMKLGK